MVQARRRAIVLKALQRGPSDLPEQGVRRALQGLSVRLVDDARTLAKRSRRHSGVACAAGLARHAGQRLRLRHTRYSSRRALISDPAKACGAGPRDTANSKEKAALLPQCRSRFHPASTGAGHATCPAGMTMKRAALLQHLRDRIRHYIEI